MSRLQGLLCPLLRPASRRGSPPTGRGDVVHSRAIAHFHSPPTSVAQPRTPVSGTTSDAPIMARLECRYGDMTQSRSTCPVIRSGDGRRAGTARLGREPTTFRLICVHDSVAAYSHLTCRRLGCADSDGPRPSGCRVSSLAGGGTGRPDNRVAYRRVVNSARLDQPRFPVGTT